MTTHDPKTEAALANASTALFVATIDRVSMILLELSRLPLREVLEAMEAAETHPAVQAVPETQRTRVRTTIRLLREAVASLSGVEDAS